MGLRLLRGVNVYNMGGSDSDDDRFKKLDKHTIGKGCLYIERLDDVDLPMLKSLGAASFTRCKEHAAE